MFKGTKEKCMSISTSGADGNVIIWELNVSEALRYTTSCCC